MSSYVRVRACADPNNFFDELIPEVGFEIRDWRFSVHRIPMPVQDKDGKMIFVDAKWLHAESDCEEDGLELFERDRLPVFRQIVQALAGRRQTHLTGNVRFSMFITEFVKDGVSRNITPRKINVGVGVLNTRIKDTSGKVLFDAKESEAAQALRARQKIRGELRTDSIRFVRNLDDAYFRRAWESFSLAMGPDEHAISHLYDVRDAVARKFDEQGESACRVLKLSDAKWREFGQAFNNGAVKGGRHNGKHPAPMQPMTREQRDKVIRFAREILDRYGEYLDGQTRAEGGAADHLA